MEVLYLYWLHYRKVPLSLMVMKVCFRLAYLACLKTVQPALLILFRLAAIFYILEQVLVRIKEPTSTISQVQCLQCRKHLCSRVAEVVLRRKLLKYRAQLQMTLQRP